MTKRFKLYALGSNSSGQLGIGHQNDISTPQLCVFDEDDMESLIPDDSIIKIIAGGNHTLALFESGVVFATGSNEHRQCCLLPRIAQTNFFRRVTIYALDDATGAFEVVNFIDISASWEASFLLGQDGRVYVFGTGSKGELGLGTNVTATGDFREAQIVVMDDRELKIRKLCSGMRHTVAISNDGEVYGWGSCRKGELGEGLGHRKIVWTPEKLNVPFECQEATVGRNFTVCFGTSCSKVFSQEEAFKEIEGWGSLLAKDNIGAGWSTAYTLLNNRVKAFGRNDSGQMPSEDLPDLKKLAAGSEHCLGLTIDLRVVAWGWGEHGNCGQPTDSHGNVAGRWNLLSVPLEDEEEVISVAAGCATSFIVAGRKFS